MNPMFLLLLPSRPCSAISGSIGTRLSSAVPDLPFFNPYLPNSGGDDFTPRIWGGDGLKNTIKQGIFEGSPPKFGG